MSHRHELPRNLLVALLTVLAVAVPVRAADPLATLRFATACAHCHEGQCSQRLSFTHGPEASFDHIRKYAGPTDAELAKRLYDTLQRMKEDCSYPPLAAPDLDRSLARDSLDGYRDSWSGDYFIPVSGVAAGPYQLVLDVAGPGSLRVELIDAEFNPLVDRCESVTGDRLSLTLALSESSLHYLRLRLRGPVAIDQLALHAGPAKADPIP